MMEKFLILVQNTSRWPSYKIQLVWDILQEIFIPQTKEAFLTWETEEDISYSLVHLEGSPSNLVQKTRVLLRKIGFPLEENQVYLTTFPPDQNRFQEELKSLVVEL